LNFFDASIISFVNSFVHRWFPLDATFALIATNTLFSGGAIAALIWWAWFRPDAKQSVDREYLSCGIFTAFLSVVAARSVAALLPYRERPIHRPELHLRMPFVFNESTVVHWSSFPSDHAAMFFALALSVFFVSRRAGIAAFCYVLLFVCAPRLFMGFHYPTDLVAGALIGIAVAYLSRIDSFRRATTLPVMRCMERSPGLFYAGFFIVTFQIAIIFASFRHIARYLVELSKGGL
jgi:membrane-associated phospholipid phosphatase